MRIGIPPAPSSLLLPSSGSPPGTLLNNLIISCDLAAPEVRVFGAGCESLSCPLLARGWNLLESRGAQADAAISLLGPEASRERAAARLREVHGVMEAACAQCEQAARAPELDVHAECVNELRGGVKQLLGSIERAMSRYAMPLQGA